MVVVAFALSPAGGAPGPLGSVVPFDATDADAVTEPSHVGCAPAPPGHAEAATFTCTVNASVALKTRPADGEWHVNEVPVPVQFVPETKDTPVGNFPDTVYPPVLSEGPAFFTLTV